MSDPVHHPAHYGKGRFTIECIEITRHMTFCAGNAVKYLWRHAEKNGVEDLDKAMVYISWADLDGVAAILPGHESVFWRLYVEHVLPFVEPGSPYQAIALVAGDRFALAGALTEEQIIKMRAA